MSNKSWKITSHQQFDPNNLYELLKDEDYHTHARDIHKNIQTADWKSTLITDINPPMRQRLRTRQNEPKLLSFNEWSQRLQ